MKYYALYHNLKQKKFYYTDCTLDAKVPSSYEMNCLFVCLFTDNALGTDLQAERLAPNTKQRRSNPVDETGRANDSHPRTGKVAGQAKKVSPSLELKGCSNVLPLYGNR